MDSADKAGEVSILLTAATLAKKFNAVINIYFGRNDHPHLRVSKSILFLFL